MKETLRYLAGIAGPSGYGSNSTAEQVTELPSWPSCSLFSPQLTAIVTGLDFIMNRMAGGTTAAKMVFITSSKMGIMCLWNLTWWKNLTLISVKEVLLCTPFKMNPLLTRVLVGSLCAESPTPQNPPPPSEWLEDTLIELYLSNYSKSGADASEDAAKSVEACNRTDVNLLSNEESEDYELEEGEWIPEDDYNPSDSIGNTLSEGFNEDEENWRAQYGQVTQVREELVVDFPVVDLWDWSMVRGAGKDGKVQVARLVGRPVKQTVKLHPSVPAGGGLLKTAPICQVSFDLHKEQRYRDRAAERRTLHGGFSFGPGQKNSLSNADDAQSSPPSVSTEEAAAEAMNMTFGAGSYARKVLENMGWKEGEALGSSTKGLLEPIRAVGNVGSAGLGWPQRAKHK
ncbi:hypothetical protein CRG98_020476 [Punica granatum]|uniref:G-patch domain-containing protein n=1 Tax=Punica granatum TaxID=22663 RepID=A0A2I0JT89_PUNGR|nr:hypothetical protein CRG98_020476 [Punica granatum]